MIIFLHNSRCSKSREALKLLEDSWKKYTLREYLKNPLDLEDLIDLQIKLWIKAIEFTRVNEEEFKNSNLDKKSSDTEILKLMSKFPKIMERPIIYDNKKALVCRPPEKVLEFIK